MPTCQLKLGSRMQAETGRTDPAHASTWATGIAARCDTAQLLSVLPTELTRIRQSQSGDGYAYAH